MDLQLKDKVVLITGGAKGIGAAITRLLCNEGAIPVIVDRDADAGWALAVELVGKSCGVYSRRSNECGDCANAVKQAVEKFGQLDALVNNAGVNDRVGLEHGTLRNMSLHSSAIFFTTNNMAHHALPHLKSSRGAIVNIASKTAVTGQGGTSGYASAKGAILALTREWAVELLP